MLLTIPKVLRKELTYEGSETLIFLINNALKNEKENIIEKEDNSNLKIKLSEIQSNIIKWMFIFWSGQIIVITAIFFAFLKK